MTNPPQLRIPVRKGSKIVCPFGKKGTAWKAGFHAGDDFDDEMKAPIYAAWSGVVRWAGDAGDGFGRYISISHSWHDIQWRSYYAHLSKTLVEIGDEVEMGDKIGEMGNTGHVKALSPNGDGTHLHFEVRVFRDGKWVPEKPVYFSEEV